MRIDHEIQNSSKISNWGHSQPISLPNPETLQKGLDSEIPFIVCRHAMGGMTFPFTVLLHSHSLAHAADKRSL